MKIINATTATELKQNQLFKKLFGQNQSIQNEIDAQDYILRYKTNQFIYDILDDISELDINYINIKYLLKERLPYLNDKNINIIKNETMWLKLIKPEHLDRYYDIYLDQIKCYSELNLQNIYQPMYIPKIL